MVGVDWGSVIVGVMQGRIGQISMPVVVDSEGHLVVAVIGGGEVNPVVIRDVYWVSRNETSVCRWVNDKTGVNALTVLSDAPVGDQPGVFYNLQPGEALFVSELCYELTTIQDDMRVEFGYTDQADGQGTFMPVTPVFRLATGGTNFQDEAAPYKLLSPPLALRYSDGVRSVTVRVQTNDADARIMVAWYGWVEEV